MAGIAIMSLLNTNGLLATAIACAAFCIPISIMSVCCSFRLRRMDFDSQQDKNGDAEAQFAELAGDGSMVLYEEDGCQQDKCGKGCLGQYLMNPFCHLRTVALREYAGYNGKKHQNQVLHDKASYGEMDIYVQIAVYKVCGEFHNHGDSEQRNNAAACRQ